ncbi:MAG: serine/threonine protein kinase [Myxococcales bacterium]|nr:serine/threonine protein kinase [Myxococcales bacterium]
MQAVAAEDSLIGLALDNKYRIVRVIGRGGMGVVYEAEHTGLGKRVAIKLILEKYTGDSEAVARFTREAQAATRIGNPHIIDVMDIGTAPDGRAYVVMELLSGSPLSKVVEEQGQMPPNRAINIMRQVLKAVGAAHAKGIVHRDLKPDNIFLLDHADSPDFVKLLDFGISKMIDPDLQVAATKLTTTGVVMGTPLYMAPEQAMGAEIDHLADVYACGVIMYELLAGKPPFDGATYAVLVAKLLTSEPPLLTEYRPGLSGKLVSAVHRALEKDPTARWQSAEAFAAALPLPSSASSVELATTQASGARAAVPPPAGRSRRWPILAASLAMLAGIGTATAIIVSQGKTKSEPTPQPETGRLEVSSEPPGAKIVIDDDQVVSDGAAVTLREGKHRIHAELDGHTPTNSIQEVRAGETKAFVIQLAPAPTNPTNITKIEQLLPGKGDGSAGKPGPGPGPKKGARRGRRVRPGSARRPSRCPRRTSTRWPRRRCLPKIPRTRSRTPGRAPPRTRRRRRRSSARIPRRHRAQVLIRRSQSRTRTDALPALSRRRGPPDRAVRVCRRSRGRAQGVRRGPGRRQGRGLADGDRALPARVRARPPSLRALQHRPRLRAPRSAPRGLHLVRALRRGRASVG